MYSYPINKQQLYTILFYHNHITAPPFFLPCFLTHSTFIMLLLCFNACDSSCKAETNGFAGTQRGCRLTLLEVILGTQRSAAASTESCFVSLKSDVSCDSKFYFKLKGCNQIKNVETVNSSTQRG